MHTYHMRNLVIQKHEVITKMTYIIMFVVSFYYIIHEYVLFIIYFYIVFYLSYISVLCYAIN